MKTKLTQYSYGIAADARIAHALLALPQDKGEVMRAAKRSLRTRRVVVLDGNTLAGLKGCNVFVRATGAKSEMRVEVLAVTETCLLAKLEWWCSRMASAP